MNPKFGYNKKEGGGNNKLSEQTKKLISRNHKRISGKENGRSLKILLLNTNEIFDCIADASRKYNISASNISLCINGIYSSTKGNNGERFIWMKYDDYQSMNESEKIQIIKNLKYFNKCRSVLCVTTGKEFVSASSAGRFYGCDPSSILKCCKGILRCTTSKDKQILEWKLL